MVPLLFFFHLTALRVATENSKFSNCHNHFISSQSGSDAASGGQVVDYAQLIQNIVESLLRTPVKILSGLHAWSQLHRVVYKTTRSPLRLTSIPIELRYIPENQSEFKFSRVEKTKKTNNEYSEDRTEVHRIHTPEP